MIGLSELVDATRESMARAFGPTPYRDATAHDVGRFEAVAEVTDRPFSRRVAAYEVTVMQGNHARIEGAEAALESMARGWSE